MELFTVQQLSCGKAKGMFPNILMTVAYAEGGQGGLPPMAQSEKNDRNGTTYTGVFRAT